jgi:hypothetical protein
VLTAAGNLVPGPHQTFTAPVEAISDFAVMTTNEMKMLFELTGQAGHRVNPLKCLAEVGLVLGLAELGKQIASQVVGKVPAGPGLVAKAAVAYSATYAIGEGIFLYQTVGERVGLEFLRDRFQARRKEAESMAEEIVRSHASARGNGNE